MNKLPDEVRANVREMFAAGVTRPKIAEKIGINYETVRYILSPDLEAKKVGQRQAAEAKRRAKRLPSGKHEIKTASPILRQLFVEAFRRRMPIIEISKKVGTSHVTMSNWKKGKSTPNVMEVEAFAQAVGYELVLRNKADVKRED